MAGRTSAVVVVMGPPERAARRLEGEFRAPGPSHRPALSTIQSVWDVSRTDGPHDDDYAGGADIGLRGAHPLHLRPARARRRPRARALGSIRGARAEGAGRYRPL